MCTATTTRRSVRPRCIAVLLVASLIAAATPALAQTAPNQTPIPADLEQSPIVAPELGIMMHLPLGARQRAGRMSGVITCEAIDSREPARWWFRLQPVRSDLEAPTARGLVQEHLSRLREAGVDYDILVDEPIAGFDIDPGHRCYILQRPEGGKPTIHGWYAKPAGTRAFLVATIIISPEAFNEIGPTLHRSFETVKRTGGSADAAAAQERLLAGRRFAQTLTEEKLRSAAHDRIYYRLYDPRAAETEMMERGWISIEAREGQRGEVDGGRDPASFTEGEQETGLLVIMQGRLIEDAKQKYFRDVDRRAWLAWDRRNEMWSNRMTQRQGEATRTESETGVRNGASLSVVKSVAQKFRREPPLEVVIPDKAYLSQAELGVLGRLLPRGTEGEAFEIESYFYDNEDLVLSRRRDTWGPRSDGRDGWQLETRAVNDDFAVDQLFDPRGIRQRRTISKGGIVTDRIDPDDLQRLWKRKGLR